MPRRLTGGEITAIVVVLIVVVSIALGVGLGLPKSVNKTTHNKVFLVAGADSANNPVLRRSVDGGVTWDAVASPLPTVITSITHDGARFYAASQRRIATPDKPATPAKFCSSVDGLTWSRLVDIPEDMGNSACAIDGDGKGNVVVMSSLGVAYYDGKKWKPTFTDSRGANNAAFSGTTCAVSGSNGVYTSEDRGESWKLLGPAQTTYRIMQHASGWLVCAQEKLISLDAKGVSTDIIAAVPRVTLLAMATNGTSIVAAGVGNEPVFVLNTNDLIAVRQSVDVELNRLMWTGSEFLGCYAWAETLVHTSLDGKTWVPLNPWSASDEVVSIYAVCGAK